MPKAALAVLLKGELFDLHLKTFPEGALNTTGGHTHAISGVDESFFL